MALQQDVRSQVSLAFLLRTKKGEKKNGVGEGEGRRGETGEASWAEACTQKKKAEKKETQVELVDSSRHYSAHGPCHQCCVRIKGEKT